MNKEKTPVPAPAPVWAWRLFAVLFGLMWVVLFMGSNFVLEPEFHKYEYLPPPLILGIQTATVLVCCLAVARPQQLYFYAAVLWFWGLFNVVSGIGGIVNMLLYFSGCAFAYKQGFFRRGRKGKLIGCVLALFAAVLSLWRLGTAYMAQSLLECFSIFFLLGGAALLFWEELGRAREHNSESLLRLTEPEFTPEDAEILRKILAAEKYESIAAESGVSVSTLKKQVKKLFGKLRVADRATFMSRYARCAVTVN